MAILEILMWSVFAIMMGAVLVAGASVVVVATRENRIYSAEAKTWQRLVHRGIPTEAQIESLKRSEHGLTRGGSHGQTVHAVELALNVFDHKGATRLATLRTLIDEALLPQFCVAGTTVHLLRDPDDASILAVDRAHTPLEIPPVGS
ncbi:hypothetical protein JR065_15635 [Xanthomonas sp. AmX2]|uniref:hypothetical protein n=1 Tax=Xanthomonas sp. TaxID=29446 RepID=UPI0019826D32|nr:hypothetical protein [Xanthomonas sp.]MBN6151778.1 hypothetical protein [Xanthomonas sp.]